MSLVVAMTMEHALVVQFFRSTFVGLIYTLVLFLEMISIHHIIP